MINKRYLYITLLIFVFIGCKKDDYETVNRSFGKGYLHGKLGSYNIYKIEEIIYDDFFNTIDTQRYQIKELNESYFLDNLNRNSMRIERYKLNSKLQWDILNVYYSTEDNYSAERIEENKRLIKLSFPFTVDAIWNSNQNNSDNPITVFYDFINEPYQIDTFQFDSAIAVRNEYINTPLRQRQYYEVYVKNIGLVYKNFISIDKNAGRQRGSKIKQQLITYVR